MTEQKIFRAKITQPEYELQPRLEEYFSGKSNKHMQTVKKNCKDVEINQK